MKTILGSVAVILFAVFFDHTRLAAEETQSSEMRFYPSRSIEWKPGPAAIPAGAKIAVLEGDPTKEGPFVVRFHFLTAITLRHIPIQRRNGHSDFG